MTHYTSLLTEQQVCDKLNQALAANVSFSRPGEQLRMSIYSKEGYRMCSISIETLVRIIVNITRESLGAEILPNIAAKN